MRNLCAKLTMRAATKFAFDIHERRAGAIMSAYSSSRMWTGRSRQRHAVAKRLTFRVVPRCAPAVRVSRRGARARIHENELTAGRMRRASETTGKRGRRNMTGPQAGFERRVHGALEASPSRIPVILGGCGTGRTWLLQRLRDARRPRRGAVHRRRALRHDARAVSPGGHSSSPFPWHGADRMPATRARGLRRAAGLLRHRARARRRAVHVPARRSARAADVRKLSRACATCCATCSKRWRPARNRFVLTTRYVARAHRLLRDATARFEVMHVPPLAAGRRDRPARAGVQRLRADGDRRPRLPRPRGPGADRRPRRLRPRDRRRDGAAWAATADPISALTALLSPDGALNHWCRFCYELRLHRARGYGALKAILDILAEEEPLTLTEISQRLHRTPGSTKDYLSWLEDVDLVTSRQKRYSFTDPLLRLWVRLHCRPVPPTAEDVAREVQRYALARLPQPEPAPGARLCRRRASRRKSARAGESSRSTDLRSCEVPSDELRTLEWASELGAL